MNILAKIKEIKYKVYLTNQLENTEYEKLNINQSPSYFNLKISNYNFAISKWVSPKRTRSYPYERVYNTLSNSKKITIIPIIKDEGLKGDRDYLQWDTISLMSLLDVYVIFAYYTDAIPNKSKSKITNQEFDNNYVKQKIQDICNYHSSALHWNTNELSNNLLPLSQIVKEKYQNIQTKTNIPLHNFDGIDKYFSTLSSDLNLFMEFSRGKSLQAQEREFKTIQPKELLSTNTKAKIQIQNFLGGIYNLTVDEISIENNTIELIESKHSTKSKLPSVSDIKDGLLKMILYSNFEYCEYNNLKYQPLAVLILTSSRLSGNISSESNSTSFQKFVTTNKFTKNQIKLIENLFIEANNNNFVIKIKSI